MKLLKNFKSASKYAVELRNLLTQKVINKEARTTEDLHYIAENYLNGKNVKSAFKDYTPTSEAPFPYYICTSVNEVIVHGGPSPVTLKNGDVVSIDVGIEHDGVCIDTCRTVAYGGSTKHERLLEVGREALQLVETELRSGITTGTIGALIHKAILKDFKVNPDNTKEYLFKPCTHFQGHGISNELHDYPSIPQIGRRDRGSVIEAGRCVCIEPVVLYSSSVLLTHVDQTNGHILKYATSDGLPSTHIENQYYITEEGFINLTPD